ncbi:NA+/H+ antiporter (napA), putative [hydrothermal vent metagenome]|uniref:NA+/H+ antiporter (NapA), putative n=1 Tax=hydrothermal vent metagenome TaxID=652676 RepID=A0A1W1EK59_9ZZZZ
MAVNDNSISIILSLSLLIWLSPYLSKILRIPTTPIEIILGSIMAYFGFLSYHEYFEILGKVGFLYLMFLAGMEVNLKELLSSPKDIINRALLFLLIMTISAISLSIFAGLSVIVIVSMPLISIGILATLSKEYGKDEEWIKLAFTIGILGEIISIASLTIIDAYIMVGLSVELIWKIAYLFGFLGFIYIIYKFLQVIFWWYPEFKTLLIPKDNSNDQDIRLSMALFFILITIMLKLHLEVALGAFIAGVAISTFFHHASYLEEKMSSLGFGFLIPIFFINVGASFNIQSLFLEGIVTGALLITSIMIISRILGGAILISIRDTKTALLSSISLSMPLTLIIAVATIGYEVKLIDILTYYQLILASLFEIIISMISIKLIKQFMID